MASLRTIIGIPASPKKKKASGYRIKCKTGLDFPICPPKPKQIRAKKYGINMRILVVILAKK